MRIPPDTQPALAGRDRELVALQQALHRVHERSSVVLLVGEPGIGKTSLWDAIVQQAGTGEALLLTARPAEAEAHAAWSGLTDLLSHVPDHFLAGLPRPQRDALDAVCLRSAPPDSGIDPRAVWAATHHIIGAVASASPVVIAIDDAHWFDAASVRTLSYVARRLPTTGVMVLATLRSLETGGPAGELLEAAGITRLDLQPLESAAIADIVQLHLGTRLTGPALARVAEASGGNPMFAIELARTNDDRPGRPTVVPASLRDLLMRRVDAVSAAARVSLAAVSAAVKPSVGQLAMAALDDGLAEAEVAGMTRIEDGRVRLVHPLIGAAAYARCDGATRRLIHSRLAEVAASEEERARHAALGAPSPDDEVLAGLDAAAAHASQQGAPAIAAELLTLALELTPASVAAIDRHLAAGDAYFRAGDTVPAREHLELVLEHATTDVQRARAAIRMAEMLWETEAPEIAIGFARRAVDVAADDRLLSAEANVVLSRALQAVDVAGGAAAAARAVALLDVDGADTAPTLLAGALFSSAAAELELGRGLDRSRFERAAELEAVAPPLRVAERANAGLASMLKLTDDLDGSRELLLALRRAVIEEGDDSSMPFVLGHLVQVELWAGRWDEAVDVALEHLALATNTGQDAQRRQAEYNLAIVAAHRGDEAAASEIASNLAAEARGAGDLWDEMLAENVLGFNDYCRNEHERAVAHFEIGRRNAERIGLREPLRTRARTDHVESLLAVGEPGRAHALLDEYEQLARSLDRASALGAAERCRAILAAARGDQEAASAAAARSLAQYDRLGPHRFVFDRGRSFLVSGQLLRRAKQKRAAHERLQEASDVFASLGAKRFVAQVQSELDRVGLRPRAPSHLTVGERRIAELAAQGLTTRQVAEAAFVSPKTVEANLSRVYRKLGLRSRAELGAWFARRE